MPHIMHTDRFAVRDWPCGPGATLSSRLREPWPAIVELEGSPRRLRLRITEDACSYIVRAEVDDAPAEAFDAELDGNRVRIVVRDPQRQLGVNAPVNLPMSCRDPQWSRVSLTFAEQIDAVASCGECGDGLLQLTLCKQTTPRERTAPEVLYAFDDLTERRPRPVACEL